MNEYCAAIDFGTNTARLLIAERSSVGLTPVHLEREVVRLGGGFTDAAGLSEEAMVRGMVCLHRFSAIIFRYGVRNVRASATSAVRDAVNGSAFVERVFEETGIRLEVISGEEEARLTLNGVMSALDSSSGSLVILDVGGGSTEFTVSSCGTPLFIKSMPIGVVRLTEGFATCADMIRRVGHILDGLAEEMAASGIHISEKTELVGTAGTATTIAAIMLEMVDYDYRRVNNLVVSRECIQDIYRRLSLLSPQERLEVKGVEKGREDLIIAGLIIIISLIEKFGFKQLKVSDFGLLEGLAISEPD